MAESGTRANSVRRILNIVGMSSHARSASLRSLPESSSGSIFYDKLDESQTKDGRHSGWLNIYCSSMDSWEVSHNDFLN